MEIAKPETCQQPCGIDIAGLSLRLYPGNPEPFGARRVPVGINFAVYSHSARQMRLVFFISGDEAPLFAIELNPGQNRTGDVWHITVEGLPGNFRYGYQADGPYDPPDGKHFDPSAVLVDPYARAITGGAVWGEPLVRRGGVHHPFRYVRRCFLPDNKFDWEGDRPLHRPLRDTIIYELHVRGFTRHDSAKTTHPGTFQGLTEKIPYLQELGVTAVELMPVNEFDEEGNPFRNPYSGEKLKKYWGYNPFAFFAPKASYAARSLEGAQVAEFRTMVRELHKAGIEVILDVVFNHTGEGGDGGPVFSFRGFENEVYYMLDEEGHYRNYSGCGNTMNCNHPLVRQLIVDCLRYWVVEMHVDGFRFDLASVLGRDRNGHVLQNPPVLEEIADDPILAGTKIIAEAWDAAGLYQVGSFPGERWAEWNGRFRDDVRRCLRGDQGTMPLLATRLAGSSDLYHNVGKKPYHSINFITSHDGFTLHDLVSYSEKHNEANGEKNRDGDNNNLSANWGAEGETDDPRVQRLRNRGVRNFLTILFFSQGTPMLLAGDEFRRTQQGNNNAYCQDNGISWVDWSRLEENREIFEFTRNLIAFRRERKILRRDYFFSGEEIPGTGLPDISWHGERAFEENFNDESRCLGALINGQQGETPEDAEEDIFIAVNSWYRARRMELPLVQEGKRQWRLLVDTAAPPGEAFRAESSEWCHEQWTFLRPFSIQVWLGKTTDFNE